MHSPSLWGKPRAAGTLENESRASTVERRLGRTSALSTLPRIPGSGEWSCSQLGRLCLEPRVNEHNQDNPSQNPSEANLSVDSLSQAGPEAFLLGVEMTAGLITGAPRGLEAILCLSATGNQFRRERSDFSTV